MTLLKAFSTILDGLEIRYAIDGSIASSVYGQGDFSSGFTCQGDERIRITKCHKGN